MSLFEKDIREEVKKEATCAVCGVGLLVPLFVKNGFELFRCGDCEHIMVYPMPSSEKLKELYAEDYFSGRSGGHGYANYDRDKEAMRSIFERHLETLEEEIEGPGRLLDVGAATGFFVGIAKNLGWDAHGVEFSEYAAALGRERGLDIAPGTIMTFPAPKESFDVISMWDVLEHMPNPKESLERVFQLLKPGGILVLNTPDSGSLFARMLGRFWHLYVPPEHLNYFNQKSLTALLKDVHFSTPIFSKVGKRFTLAYVAETLASWQKFAVWKWLAKALRKFPSLAAFSIPIHLRDNMYVVTTKPL